MQPISRFFAPKPNKKARLDKDCEELKCGKAASDVHDDVGIDAGVAFPAISCPTIIGPENKSDEAGAHGAKDEIGAAHHDEAATQPGNIEGTEGGRTSSARGEIVRVNRFAKWGYRSDPIRQSLGGTAEGKFVKETTAPFLRRPAALHLVRAKIAEHDKKWVPMKELSEADQLAVADKWHSMILYPNNDPTTAAAKATTTPTSSQSATLCLEDARFQILVAALLHARCQEPVVRAAMARLAAACPLTVAAVAAADPADLVGAIRTLQYHTAKAGYLVRAARNVQAQCARGEVPEDEAALRELPGIGPVFADLLAAINTRRVHARRRADSSLPAT